MKKKVIIEVCGGMVDLVEKPEGVEVMIRVYDNNVQVVVVMEKGWIQDPKVFSDEMDAQRFVIGVLREEGINLPDDCGQGNEGNPVSQADARVLDAIDGYNQNGNGDEIHWFETKLIEKRR